MPPTAADRLREKILHLQETVQRLTTRVRDLQRSERALRRARGHERLVLDALPDLLIEIDDQGRITDVRAPQADCLSLPPEAFLGKRFRDVLPANAATVFHDAIQRAFASGRDVGATCELDTPAGPRWFELSVAATPAGTRRKRRLIVLVRPITRRQQARREARDAAGEVTDIVGNSPDISERQRAEQERLSLERRTFQTQKLESLGLLAGGFAHDFNNILTAILGYADLALRGMSLDAPEHGHLDEIRSAAHRAADLCRQMLAYSGRGRLVVEPVDVSGLVADMTPSLGISISSKIALQYRLADDLPAVDADATQVREIVMNLILNASEAIGDRPGVVTVTTGTMECDATYLASALPEGGATPGAYVYLDVSDTGCGMPPDTLARMFDPFFSTKLTNRGLGLAAVLGIVRGHGGAIRVESTPGEGSAFRVLLKAAPQVARPVPKESVAARGWRGSGTILVVDDEEVVRSLAKAMLERLGFTVVLAADGVEALDVVRARPGGITCVLLDLMMPRMGGRETLEALRRISPDLPVILSSGYERQHVEAQFAGLALTGFIQKPYQWASLSEAVRQAIRGGRGSAPRARS